MDQQDCEIVEITESPEEMLNYLINEYGMNTKSLSKVLDVESSVLDNFHENKDEIPMGQRGLFAGVLGTLYYASKITPDERNRAIIDVLIINHLIEIDTIARIAKVKKQDVEDFMNKDISVPSEIKYKIATASMFLHFMFKPNNDENLKTTIKAIRIGIDNESINKLTGATYEEIDTLRSMCSYKVPFRTGVWKISEDVTRL